MFTGTYSTMQGNEYRMTFPKVTTFKEASRQACIKIAKVGIEFEISKYVREGYYITKWYRITRNYNPQRIYGP